MMDLREYNCAGSGLKKKQRQQPMPGYRQSHALYFLREIKWIVCQCIVYMEKCISVPHDRKIIFCFPSHEKKIFWLRKVLKKNLRAQSKSQAPPNKKMDVALNTCTLWRLEKIIPVVNMSQWLIYKILLLNWNTELSHPPYN